MLRLFRTLRGQLFVGLLVPLVAVALINVWFSYRNARATSYIVLDHDLAASASTIAEQVRASNRRLDVEIPPAALGMFATGYADVVYYRVVDERGELISGYADLPHVPPHSPRGLPWYADGIFRGRDVRLVALSQPVPSAAGTRHAYVTVAVTLQATNAMIRDLWVSNDLEQAALVIAAFALAWLSVLRGFSPLLRIGREVADRRPNEFKPFDTGAVPRELLPFIRALNRYMERLSSQLASHRRFIANAAHQLRTPITLLRTQAQVALREDSLGQKDEAARGIIETTRHMARLINQLLILSKMEAGTAGAAVRVDFVGLTRSVLEEYADLAIAAGADLAFEPHTTDAYVECEPTMLREVVANLADNALRYGEGRGVTVSVESRHGYAVLRVVDNGPGIPEEDRELVFERFYRGSDRAGTISGSGLGLSIVREIVASAHGRVQLSANPDGSGLCAVVSMPLCAEAPTDVTSASH